MRRGCLHAGGAHADEAGFGAQLFEVRRAVFTVFPPPLCLRARCKRACRVRGRFCARSAPRAGARGPPPPQTSCSYACRSSLSRFCFQQFRFVAGIIIHRPHIRQRFVSGLEILPASIESSQHSHARHVVSTLFHPRSDATQRQWYRRETQEHDFNPIAAAFQRLSRWRQVNPLNVLSKAKSRRALASRSSSPRNKRPAVKAARSGRNGDNPAASKSVFTK